MKYNIPELPCENLVRLICGASWRSLSDTDLDAALGIGMTKMVLDGVEPSLKTLADKMQIDEKLLEPAFRRLEMNGKFLKHNLSNIDAKVVDVVGWGFVGGVAAGATGLVQAYKEQ